ncbi:DUF4271 domain-containing protein [Mongoliitalea daihaiensis]|uniref:DUF4271 domain-containing protein n=1 Tax=Mongoliitalea daihaiensis TaxID=2782006 RepID=UPI001F400762|nr:DUF4271 domain-containing protein [Mongoliitalea daihaiensis]UJP66274.1 DUF4271 domain-containing protein [Mongoliitalea daihaiensis]
MGKYWLIISFIFLAYGELHAQILENYSGMFDHQSKKSWNYKSDQVSTTLDVSSFPSSMLRFYVPEKNTVFLDNKIWFYSEKDTTVLISLEELHERFDFQGQSTVSLVVYGQGVSLNAVTLEKGYFQSLVMDVQGVSEADDSRRNRSSFKDFYFLGICILLSLFAIVKIVFPVELNFMLSPKAIFSVGDNMDWNPKFFSLDVLFFLFLIGLGMVQSIMFFVYYFDSIHANLINPFSLNDLFFKWIIGAVIFVGLSVVKYLYLSFMTYVFNFRKFEVMHFFYLLRIISLLVVVLIIVQTLVLTNDMITAQNWHALAKNGVFTIYLIATVFLYVLMTNQLDFKFYHLIAYLCTAELLPFLIVSKYMMW